MTSMMKKTIVCLPMHPIPVPEVPEGLTTVNAKLAFRGNLQQVIDASFAQPGISTKKQDKPTVKNATPLAHALYPAPHQRTP
jgi:hypothetical protein